jgi:NAD(P)-dependent dehydrogenase (short-subunit alcohol dehydrogenase family)
MDLASFASIKDAATTFTSQSKRLDILINNAGIMACPMGETVDGYEIQLGTNHMGHALLTKLLVPTLLDTAKEPGADVRVVNLSSSAHQMAPWGGVISDKAVLAQKREWVRYANSKLANILFAKELAKRYPAIKSVAVHPGAIRTDLWQHSVNASTLLRWGVNTFGGLWLQDIAKGAMNQLWAATAKDVTSGVYYTPVGHAASGTGDARNEKLAARLWDWTEEELAKHGY